MFNEFFVWILVLVLLAVCYWYFTIPPGLPPGPTGYPVIGSLLSISRYPYQSFIGLGKKYGNVFNLYMGSNLAIVLNDFEAIKEAFVRQGNTFAGRIREEQISLSGQSQQGILTSDGEFWKKHRRFILHSLRDNGVGKLSVEPLILNEVQFFLAEMRKHDGKPYEVKRLLMSSLVNNVFILITGQRYNYDDNSLIKVVQLLDELIREITTIAIQNFFPWMEYIPGIGLITKIKYKRENVLTTFNIIQEMIETALKRSDKQPNDSYSQAYLNERQRRLELNGSEDLFTEIGLYMNSRDLLMAGGETSSTFLHWALLYMTFYPEVQSKVQQEIDRSIGRDREPSYTDRLITPYTEATLIELQRIASVAPLGITHRNTKDTTLNGYNIPKNTVIISNLYAVHHDPKLWGDPDNFRPERFIGNDGKVNKPEYLIPFSIGKRQCAGEPLAAVEVYLYFVSILQHFDVVPVHGVNQSLDSNWSTVRQPLCPTVCVKIR